MISLPRRAPYVTGGQTLMELFGQHATFGSDTADNGERHTTKAAAVKARAGSQPAAPRGAAHRWLRTRSAVREAPATSGTCAAVQVAGCPSCHSRKGTGKSPDGSDSAASAGTRPRTTTRAFRSRKQRSHLLSAGSSLSSPLASCISLMPWRASRRSQGCCPTGQPCATEPFQEGHNSGHCALRTQEAQCERHSHHHKLACA